METPVVETVSGMCLGRAPRCFQCKTTESCIWQRDLSRGVILCADCNRREAPAGLDDASSQCNSRPGTAQRQTDNFGVALNKSPRKVRGKNGAAAAKLVKGRSRHALAKKTPYKAPAAVSTVMTSDYVYHKGMYLQLGDVVSLMDGEDGGVYYAAIRGLLQDQYCEKSAVLTWLLPTEQSPLEGFCPQTYVLGPEEDLPRKLDYMQFVCHAPSDYFKDRKSPYPTAPVQPEMACIWTSVGAQIVPRPSREQLFGIAENVDDPGSDKEGEKEAKEDKKDKSKKKKKESKKETVKDAKDVKSDKIKAKEKSK